MTEDWNWTTKDLEKLIGQAETLRLDFKQSKLFNEGRENIIQNLTREISAFANTEGGTLVIRIVERKDGKARVADHIDEGIDIQKYNPEWLQQIIESNISPYIPGIRVKPIFLDSEKKKCAYVIVVPSGSTAYQSSDKRYYGRSEYESKALPDHEIRLRMFRGKYPNAVIDIVNCKTSPSSSAIRVNSEGVPKYKFSFWIILRNIGEININEFKVLVKYKHSGDLNLGLDTFQESFKDGYVTPMPAMSEKYLGREYPQSINIYPEDEYLIHANDFILQDEELPSSSSIIMYWRLYLKDVRPIDGEINLIYKFKNKNFME
jgi:Putative DNA-binding domain